MTDAAVLADKPQTHFIIRGLEGQTVPAAEAFGNFFGSPGPGTDLRVGTGVTVLASAGGLPQPPPVPSIRRVAHAPSGSVATAT
jgi:hypothetical protein